jgi:hypothetical protein
MFRRPAWLIGAVCNLKERTLLLPRRFAVTSYLNGNSFTAWHVPQAPV